MAFASALSLLTTSAVKQVKRVGSYSHASVHFIHLNTKLLITAHEVYFEVILSAAAAEEEVD